jgi:Zn-dependent protease
MNVTQILDVILSLIAVFTAIVLHEVAHGYVAYRLGDPTAKVQGRLSLNPLAHVDPIGTILVPLFLVIVHSPFLIGWAKPVPINPGYFRNPLKGMLYVALAGPGMNVLLALSTVIVGRVALLAFSPAYLLYATGFGANLVHAVFFLLGMFVVYNVILAVFNMIPIPPLDGFGIIEPYLPREIRDKAAALGWGGLFVLFFVFFQVDRPRAMFPHIIAYALNERAAIGIGSFD